jgi:hypothetical protein
MAETGYLTHNLLFRSKGIVARPADDTIGPEYFLNENSCEEIEENGIATRLGSQIINRTGTTVNALPSTVYSLAKLGSLNGNAYRYAGAASGLYRRSDLSQGAYSLIHSAMSGKPWVSAIYNPAATSLPYLFIADSAGMLKDNGTLAAPQQWGIFQPQYPISAQAQTPTQITLDNYRASAGSYTYTGISSGTTPAYVATTLTSAVTATGINTVTVGAPSQIGLFQLLTIDSGGNAETVLVIQVTATGFVASFTKTHTVGAAIGSQALSVTVPASTTASISKSFAGTPISAWPTTLSQEDYIGLYLYVSDPSQIQKIILSFDCGNGSFQSDYFYRTIGQGPLQTLLDTNTDSSTSAADAVLSDTLGLFTSASSGVTQLNTGLTQWTPILMQLSDFAGAGRADFGSPNFNWSKVNGYQIQIVSNNNTSVTVQFAALQLFGGAGPDSFAGVSYDWLWTYYNAADGTESNPCMVMTDLNPPLQTNFITPRRQGVLLTMNHPFLDPQVTHIRIYRRGGTLASNYYRVDQVPCSGALTTYLDIFADYQIESADTVSFTNDVPVTSSLVTPVLTFLSASIFTTNQAVTVTPDSMANISVNQQVNLGNIAAPNYETVIVLAVTPTNFTAFVQNTHAVLETIGATAAYGVPVSIVAQAFDQMYFAGDPNNPNYLYYSAKGNPQAVSSAAYVPVSTPDDPITAIVATRANLFVSTVKRWWSISPGSQPGSAPTVYPTAADRGNIAPQGVCVKGESVFYQAIDGIRVFTGGGSNYTTRIIEFIFQGIGTTPIVEADRTQLSQTVMTFWNQMVFISYVGKDGLRHRVILDTESERWRNDDQDAQSILLESDTNTILYGDSYGVIHQDRMDLAYDEANVGGFKTNAPIQMTAQTPYSDQGEPAIQKQYNEFTLDANTNNQTVTCTLLFNDGQSSLVLGTVKTSQRARTNLTLNQGLGVQAYKCSLLLTCPALQRVFLYQAKIRAIGLAETRQSLDTYQRDFGTPESKMAKNVYIDYNASAPVTVTIYYDTSTTVAPFVFTLPIYNGLRKPFRQRLPAVKFRVLRMVMDSEGNDFQIWDSSNFDVKPVGQGKGYEKMPLLAVEK